MLQNETIWQRTQAWCLQASQNFLKAPSHYGKTYLALGLILQLVGVPYAFLFSVGLASALLIRNSYYLHTLQKVAKNNPRLAASPQYCAGKKMGKSWLHYFQNFAEPSAWQPESMTGFYIGQTNLSETPILMKPKACRNLGLELMF